MTSTVKLRSLRYERSFTVLVIQWPRPITDTSAIERTLRAQLRRIDAASWANACTLHVLLAESGGTEAAAFIARIRNQLDPTVRIGHASCPSDGADTDQLVASATSAVAGAGLG